MSSLSRWSILPVLVLACAAQSARSQPAQLTPAQLAECREMAPEAASRMDWMMKQATPNASPVRRALIAGNVCFEMKERYEKASDANCPADVMADMRTLRDGAQRLVDIADSMWPSKVGCHLN